MFVSAIKKQQLKKGGIFLICLFILFVPNILFAAKDPLNNTVQRGLYDFCISLGGAILTYSGSWFNVVMENLVIGMGEFIRGGNESNSGSIIIAVNTLWEVVRDLFNIAFIFGLIYIGFKTILGTDENGTRRWLISLIGAAIFINFSLYATQAVIEFSNVTAKQIYGQIHITYRDTDDPAGISNMLMQYARLETYADPNHAVATWAQKQDNGKGGWRVVMYAFLMMIFMLITAFVLAAGAIMMLVRFVTLILLMIFSPAMFLGWIFPGMAQYTSKWVRMLLSNAFLAPAYIFMIYLSLVVIDQMNKTDGSFAKAFTEASAGGGAFSIILQFSVLIALMISSLIVAKQIGAVGATQSVNIGNSMRRTAMGYAKNAALLAPRAGLNLGRVGVRWGVGAASAEALSDFDKWQASKKKGRLGRATAATMEFMNLDRSIRGTLEKGKNVKAGLKYSYQQNKDYADERRRRKSSGAAEQEREQKVNNGLAAISSGTIDEGIMKDLADAMKKMTDKQLSENIDLSTLTNENIAIHLTTKQIDALKKSGKYSDAEVGEIEKARSNGFKNIANENPGRNSAYNAYRTPEWLIQKGTDEMSKMPTEVFTSEAVVPYLTPAMVEAKIKSGINADDADKIRMKLEDYLNNNGTSPKKIQAWKNWRDKSVHAVNFGLELPGD